MAGLDGTGKTQPTSRASRFSEILKFKQAQEADLEVEQPSENLPPDEIVEPTPEPAAPPAPVEAETKAKAGRRGKVSKRSNPDYMQAIFHLPVKTSKRLDRELLDLGEAGVDLDRSEFAEELLQSFFRLSEEVGADEARKQFRNLGSK
jgi:hypothetical protein